MKEQSKLNQHQEALEQQQTEQSAAREFATVDEMLRHDALHTPVPPRIAQRLNESLAQLPAPPRSWWQRLFGA